MLETQRSALEELERIEEAISGRILYNPHILPDTHSLENSSALHGKKKRPVRDNLIHGHEVAKLLDRYEEQCNYLKRSFAKVSTDMDDSHPAKLRAKEVDELTYEQFQKQVAGIRDFHKRYPNEGVENQEMLFKMTKDRIREEREMGILPENDEDNEQRGQLQQERLLSAFAVDLNVDSMFSGEEFYGRFMDLVGLHERFLNLKFLNRSFTYLQYLENVANFNDKSVYGPSRFRDPEYFSYVADLHNYLVSFLKRTHPLEAPENVLRGIDNDFDSAWCSKSLTIQQNGNDAQQGNASEGQVAADGTVWCEACAKSFKNEAVYKGHLNGNKHKKNVNMASSSGSDGIEDVKLKTLAYHEYCIYHLAEFLAKHLSETRANVERKQALTDRERQLETEALESEVIGSGLMDSDAENNEGEDEDDNDDVVYNPLKLPLGWDGKPIPYWLWKLNGLGIEFLCEICGNHTYMGRKAFEKHFMEARHTHGLKCLGIQPSVLFKNITNIKEAVARKYAHFSFRTGMLTLYFSLGQDQAR